MFLNFFHKPMNNGVKCEAFLKKGNTGKLSLNQLVELFEKMCQISLDNDMILFETGTFDFTGQPLFYFSLVRQYPNDDEEYFQIHMDVLYQPNEKTRNFQSTVWNEDIKQNIFDYVRQSEIFLTIENDVYMNVDIYIDET